MKNPWLFTRCKLDRVIDGDSMRLIVDTGFHHSANIHIRLLGVDTPERGRDPEKWRLSREFAESWFSDAAKFTFECVGQEKYGRWLGTVHNGSGGSLSQALIIAGLGVVYMGGAKP